MSGAPHTSDAATINGRPVVVTSRQQSSYEASDAYIIEAFVIEGASEEWPIGTKVTISMADDRIDGRVTSVWVDAQKNQTHLRVYAKK